MNPEVSDDLNRLRVELKALGGVLDALWGALQRPSVSSLPGPILFVEVHDAAVPDAIPEHHLVAYT